MSKAEIMLWIAAVSLLLTAVIALNNAYSLWEKLFGSDESEDETRRQSAEALKSRALDTDPEGWNHHPHEGIYTYNPDPRFHIEKEDQDRKFSEPWTSSFHDSTAYMYEFKIYFDGRLISKDILISVDGGRLFIPLPESNRNRQISRDQYRLAKIINYYQPYGEDFDRYLNQADIAVQ